MSCFQVLEGTFHISLSSRRSSALLHRNEKGLNAMPGGIPSLYSKCGLLTTTHEGVNSYYPGADVRHCPGGTVEGAS